MRHKVANLDGPVHYIDFGGDGPAFLMVHGLGGSALNWMAVAPEIVESYHALAIDLAGFGQTPLFGRSATVGANATLVHRFIADVIREPVTLMGNSMGGHIAVLEAAGHPASVSAMVLVDAAVPGRYAPRTEAGVVSALAALSIPGLGPTLLDRQLRGLDARRLVERTLALVCADRSRVDPEVVAAHVKLTSEREHLGRQNARAFVQAFRSIGFRLANPRFWVRVAKVQAPTLIIHGSLDRVIPLAAAQELARRRPDWQLEVLEGVGHVPMLEAPSRFMKVLSGWSAYRIPSRSAAAS